MTSKYCKSCDQIKTIDRFYPRSSRKNSYSAWCKPCTIEHNGTYRDKEQLKKYKANYYKQNKLGRKLQADLKKYGITLTQYNDMLSAQGGRCAMCKLPPSINKRMSVDHSHLTGTVRGLLCSSCNFILGLAKDSIAVLKNAVAYLEQYEK